MSLFWIRTGGVGMIFSLLLRESSSSLVVMGFAPERICVLLVGGMLR